MSDCESSICIADVMRAVETRRHELAVTPEELARRSGMSRRTINACLAGQTEISLRLLLRIATALQLTLQLAPEPGRDARPLQQPRETLETRFTAVDKSTTALNSRLLRN
jgi:transcriptional regulator with XRE-family HTH domain